MSDVSAKCVFCEKDTCEKIRKFTPETFKKCITILEYRKVKPVLRKSSTAYATVLISEETYLYDGYHVQCYKLFTAIKIPPDFRMQNEIKRENALECVDANELVIKNLESIHNTATMQAGDPIDEAGPSIKHEPKLEDCDDPFDADESVTNEDLIKIECVDAPEFAEESLELSIPSMSTMQAVGTIDEAGPSIKHEPKLDDCDEPFDADKSVTITKEDLLLRECFLCKRSRKRRHGRDVPLALNKLRTVELLKSTATEHNDIEMLKKISSFTDCSAIPYHKCCKDLYLREINKKEESDFVKKRKASKTAYDLLCEILEEHVVKKNECLFLDHVKREYHRLQIEQCKLLSDSIDSISISDRYLENKIMDTFAKKIKIICVEKKKDSCSDFG